MKPVSPKVSPAQKENLPVPVKPILVKRDWLAIAILAIVVAVLWVGITVYNILNTPTITEPQAVRMQLFSPKLDETVLTDLESRKTLGSGQLDEVKRVIVVSKESQQEQQEEQTPTLTPTESPAITPTGEPAVAP